jgi:hypothetical protein
LPTNSAIVELTDSNTSWEALDLIDGNFVPVGFIGSPDIVFSAVGVQLTLTPLPATLPLLATGLGALGLLGWRRKREGARKFVGGGLTNLSGSPGSSAQSSMPARGAAFLRGLEIVVARPQDFIVI